MGGTGVKFGLFVIRMCSVLYYSIEVSNLEQDTEPAYLSILSKAWSVVFVAFLPSKHLVIFVVC